MPCDVVELEGGTAIVCTHGGRRCVVCGARAVALCDALLEPAAFGRRPRTCDAGMCADHRRAAGPNVDYCPTHAEVPV